MFLSTKREAADQPSYLWANNTIVLIQRVHCTNIKNTDVIKEN